jgi:hypothetical protein
VRIVNTRLALATAQKGTQSVTEYVGKMCTLGDEMAAVGKPIDNDELLTDILTGLDIKFIRSSLRSYPGRSLLL